MLRRILIISLTLCLAACGPLRQPKSYTLVPPSTAKGQRCLKNCHTIKAMCYKMCQDVDGSCYENAKARAKQRYASYVESQQKAEAEVTKTWENFYNPKSCKDQACGCKKDYNACFQMCGGKLVPVY